MLELAGYVGTAWGDSAESKFWKGTNGKWHFNLNSNTVYLKTALFSCPCSLSPSWLCQQDPLSVRGTLRTCSFSVGFSTARNPQVGVSVLGLGAGIQLFTSS